MKKRVFIFRWWCEVYPILPSAKFMNKTDSKQFQMFKSLYISIPKRLQKVVL